MKRMFLMAMLMAMSIGVFTSCSKDEEENVKPTLEEIISGKTWTVDQTKKAYRFYKNHSAVYMGNGSSSVDKAYHSGSGYAVGTWATMGDALNVSFRDGRTKDVNYDAIVMDNWSVQESETMLIKLLDRNKQMVALNAVDTFTDYTDDSEHDGALCGTWTSTKYWDMPGTGYTGTLHLTMVISNDGTYMYAAKELNVLYASTYKTKDGVIEFEEFDVFKWGPMGWIYIREGNTLFMQANASTNMTMPLVWTRVETMS